MENKKCVKIRKDFFEDKKIKKMRRLKDGDKMLHVYLKLLLESSQLGGVIAPEGLRGINDFIAATAEAIDEHPEDVYKTIDYLVNAKMAKLNDEGTVLQFKEEERVRYGE
jgi:hypothetical protein